MVQETLGQQDEAAKAQYPIDCEVRVKDDGDWGRVVGYTETVEFHYKTRETAVVQIRHYFGFVKDYAVDKVELWVDAPTTSNPLIKLLGTVLCGIGLHVFEKEPVRKDLLKNTGVDFVFWTSGVQKALKTCTREGCLAEKKVWREGWCGAGGKGTRWKSLSSRKEAYIDSLGNI